MQTIVGVQAKDKGGFWVKVTFNPNLERGSEVRGVVLHVFSREPYFVCCLIEIACFLSVFRHYFIENSGFSQKPPGGIIPIARRHISDRRCSCFGMNRLAAMKFCQAARHGSRSVW